MKKQDYTTTVAVAVTAEEAFKSINSVADWWSANFEGQSGKRNDVFTVRFGEVFITMKVVELIPYSNIRWEVIDCYKPWLKNKQEWNGTQISWEISSEKNTTNISFTHIGLVPALECYDGCEKAWSFYVKDSLFKLLTEGKGIPELKNKKTLQ